MERARKFIPSRWNQRFDFRRQFIRDECALDEQSRAFPTPTPHDLAIVFEGGECGPVEFLVADFRERLSAGDKSALRWVCLIVRSCFCSSVDSLVVNAFVIMVMAFRLDFRRADGDDSEGPLDLGEVVTEALRRDADEGDLPAIAKLLERPGGHGEMGGHLTGGAEPRRGGEG